MSSPKKVESRVERVARKIMGVAVAAVFIMFLIWFVPIVTRDGPPKPTVASVFAKIDQNRKTGLVSGCLHGKRPCPETQRTYVPACISEEAIKLWLVATNEDKVTMHKKGICRDMVGARFRIIRDVGGKLPSPHIQPVRARFSNDRGQVMTLYTIKGILTYSSK